MSDWISLDNAVVLARLSGATDENLIEILSGGFQEGRIGITAVLKYAPVDRVREHFPAWAARLDAMLCWRTPRHVEEFLSRGAAAIRCIEPYNILFASMLWGTRPHVQVDTCILADVHVRRPDLAFELEAAGFAVPEKDPPGPQGSDLAATAWAIALQILEDDETRPPRGHGRLMMLARKVNAKLGQRHQDDSVRKAIGPSLREWERQNSRK